MSKEIVEFLDLGMQPMANAFLKKNQLLKKEQKYKLTICYNKINYMVSIKNTFSSKKMFNNKYPYRSSMSKSVQKSFLYLTDKIKKKFKPKNILEIGSNDGAFIKYFEKKKVVGIEPCANVEVITKRMGYKTYPKFWNDKTSRMILKRHGKFDVVFSANTLSHIRNLNNVFKNIYKVLNDNGILIIEDPSLLECLKRNTYDQFYNEHIYVFSTVSLNNILKNNNLEIYKIENLKIHDGSLRYYIKKTSNNIKLKNSFKKQIKKEINFGLTKVRTYFKFKQRVQISKKKLLNLFISLKKKENKIIGYGATAKSTTILNYCKINSKLIDYFLDTTPDKQNKFTPGTKIKIKKYKNGVSKDVNYVFLGAWNFQKEIFKKEKKFIRNGGKFITHTPMPKIL